MPAVVDEGAHQARPRQITGKDATIRGGGIAATKNEKDGSKIAVYGASTSRPSSRPRSAATGEAGDQQRFQLATRRGAIPQVTATPARPSPPREIQSGKSNAWVAGGEARAPRLGKLQGEQNGPDPLGIVEVAARVGVDCSGEVRASADIRTHRSIAGSAQSALWRADGALRAQRGSGAGLLLPGAPVAIQDTHMAREATR